MVNPTGFMKFPRIPLPTRDPRERIHDWNEFHDHLPEATLREQGGRCMDCGVPFCHTGQIIDGLATGCPSKDAATARDTFRRPPKRGDQMGLFDDR